jgi:hypothetical protein
MSAITGLHARKKANHHHANNSLDDNASPSDVVDIEIAKPPTSGGGTDRIHLDRSSCYYRIRKFIRSEIGIAFETLLMFLVITAIVCWVMLHHSHRKVRKTI